MMSLDLGPQCGQLLPLVLLFRLWGHSPQTLATTSPVVTVMALILAPGMVHRHLLLSAEGRSLGQGVFDRRGTTGLAATMSMILALRPEAI